MIARFVHRETRPHLHALVHRYGIPKGTPVRHQEQARDELAGVLREAYEAGRRDERERLRRQIESFLARLDTVLSEETIAPECTGRTAFWCPVCGDCVCQRGPYGDCDFDADDCPLHGFHSQHAEGA